MQITPPFGRLITAMVTPFSKSGEIDWAGVEKIAAHLVSTGHDGIAVNGTTGEAPTTSDELRNEASSLRLVWRPRMYKRHTTTLRSSMYSQDKSTQGRSLQVKVAL